MENTEENSSGYIEIVIWFIGNSNNHRRYPIFVHIRPSFSEILRAYAVWILRAAISGTNSTQSNPRGRHSTIFADKTGQRNIQTISINIMENPAYQNNHTAPNTSAVGTEILHLKCKILHSPAAFAFGFRKTIWRTVCSAKPAPTDQGSSSDSRQKATI